MEAFPLYYSHYSNGSHGEEVSKVYGTRGEQCNYGLSTFTYYCRLLQMIPENIPLP